jgi:hypothetical protein
MNNIGGINTKVLGTTSAQTYADEIALVDESAESIQRQIEECEQFFNFANIKLNPAKCDFSK